ncbi:MAG TPA: hypothetical protein VK589_11815 [Chryseolinea sp.]|nr:hypothetical protein [Chryseolinea sp.]
MHRPEKVYLDEPITISETKVNHTEAGLKYLIDHYKQMLSFQINEAKIKSADRQHYVKLIDTYTFHLQLYEHERAPKIDVQPDHLYENNSDDQREKEAQRTLAELHNNGNGVASGGSSS